MLNPLSRWSPFFALSAKRPFICVVDCPASFANDRHILSFPALLETQQGQSSVQLKLPLIAGVRSILCPPNGVMYVSFSRHKLIADTVLDSVIGTKHRRGFASTLSPVPIRSVFVPVVMSAVVA